jgi:hypothetical protein
MLTVKSPPILAGFFVLDQLVVGRRFEPLNLGYEVAWQRNEPHADPDSDGSGSQRVSIGAGRQFPVLRGERSDEGVILMVPLDG